MLLAADSLPHYWHIIKQPASQLNFCPITFTETRCLMAGMKLTKSTVEDGISMRMLKHHRDILTAPVANIINTSHATNTFPDCLKLNKIIPILKYSKDSMLPSSYRLINLCPAVSNLIKIHVQKQLITHMEKNKPDGQDVGHPQGGQLQLVIN